MFSEFPGYADAAGLEMKQKQGPCYQIQLSHLPPLPEYSLLEGTYP